jgi:hypothetical protein
MCVPYISERLLPICKIAATLLLEDQVLPIRPTVGRTGFCSLGLRLISGKPRLALFPEGPDALLGIRRP